MLIVAAAMCLRLMFNEVMLYIAVRMINENAFGGLV